MKRISRFTAAVIACVFLFSTTSVAVAVDDKTAFSDVKDYVVKAIK